MTTDTRWAALCARSESDRPHEWPGILTVIRNRVESGKFPGTVESVVRQPWQFSYFNQWRNSVDSTSVFDHAMKGNAGKNHTLACEAAELILNAPEHELPFGPKVFNFWSPVSMVPPMKLPDWNWNILRCFPVSGVDPVRFMFGETVKEGHVLSGPPAWMFEFAEEPEEDDVA